MRAARWGFEAAAPAITVDDQEGRRLGVGPDAPYWQRELRQRQRPPCRACLLSSRAKEGLASSMKEAQFASTMRRRFRLPAVTASGRRGELDHFLLYRQLRLWCDRG